MKNVTWDYIAGFFDADGCLYKKKNQNSFVISLSNTDILMIKSMQKFLLKQEIQSHIDNVDNNINKKYYHLRITKWSDIQKFILSIKDKSISYKLKTYLNTERNKHHTQLSDFEKDQIKILYKYGFSGRAIARAINRGYTTISNHIYL